jgi:hypothetical protein
LKEKKRKEKAEHETTAFKTLTREKRKKQMHREKYRQRSLQYLPFA